MKIFIIMNLMPCFSKNVCLTESFEKYPFNSVVPKAVSVDNDSSMNDKIWTDCEWKVVKHVHGVHLLARKKN